MSECDSEASVLRRTLTTRACWTMRKEKDNINVDVTRKREKVFGAVLFGSEQEALIGCFIQANKPVSMQVERFRTS